MVDDKGFNDALHVAFCEVVAIRRFVAALQVCRSFQRRKSLVVTKPASFPANLYPCFPAKNRKEGWQDNEHPDLSNA